MIINAKIRQTLREVSEKSIEHANTVSNDYRYLRRILKVYDTHLTEEERIYLFKTLLELVHYRNVMVDPDNLLVMSNIKLRTYMFIFILSTFTLLIGAALFKTNSTLNGFLQTFSNFITLFSL